MEPPENAIPVDVLLSPDLDVSEFDAIVFVGRFTPEFRLPGRGGVAAAAVIEKFRRQNGVIAAICEGQGVLAVHGILNGKSVATNRPTRDNPTLESLPIQWTEKTVETDLRVVTAAAPEYAGQFADAILKAIGN